jgi:hypothetical protein
MTVTAARPYQVCLYVGSSAPTLPGVRVVNLTPAADTAESVISALRSSDLTPADLRSRVLFVADGGSVYHRRSLLTYAALLGFAKRRLDVSFGLADEALVMSDFDAALRRTPDAGRPTGLLPQAQVGGPARTDLLQVDLAKGLTPETASVLRYSRRLRFVPPPALAHALPQLVVIAALRARGDTDKLPFLCDGSEPAPVPADSTEVVGICLDTLRREAEDIRRSFRSDNRDALAEPVPTPAWRERLVLAASIPVVETLNRLGARSKLIEVDAKHGTDQAARGEKVTVEVWHCPRPDRHTNGDATPSARVTVKNGVTSWQCYRCLRERVDSLRLIMDVRDCTADEAADWLLAPAAPAGDLGTAEPMPAEPVPAEPMPAEPVPAHPDAVGELRSA